MIQAWTACASTHHSLELHLAAIAHSTRRDEGSELAGDLVDPRFEAAVASSRVRPCLRITYRNGTCKSPSGTMAFFLYLGTKETDAEVGGSHFSAACSSSRTTRLSRWRTVSSSEATVRTRGPRAILHIVDIGAHQVADVGHCFEAGINFVVDPAPMR